MNKKSERGQVLILLLLIVLVVLTIVLAIAERSVSSLSNSDKTDQSSRAYSAAEAGVEQTIQSGTTTGITTTSLSNQSTYEVSTVNEYPDNSDQMLEYPPIDKSIIAQFWLVEPSQITTGPYYNNNDHLYLYFGNDYAGNVMDTTSESAEAVEIEYITCTSSCNNSNATYTGHKRFYDSKTGTPRSSPNGFTTAPCPGYTVADSEFGSNRPFLCKADLDLSSIAPGETPILIRVRTLYNNEKQALGLAPQSGLSIPQQATLFTSTGKSGNSVVTIQVFQIPNVVSPFMDYALFSVKDISK